MRTLLIRTHLYAEDLEVVGACRHCGLPSANRVHQLPDTAAAMSEHRRRAGDMENE